VTPRGSRIPGLGAGLLAWARRVPARCVARAKRAPARLDPGEWVIRHRRADVYVPVAFFAAGTAALAFSAAPALSIAIGLPPLAFILLVMIRAHRANAARRHEVMGEIDGAHYLVHQCVGYLELLARHHPDDRRARLVLNWIASGTRLLVTRYRRYLDEKAVGAAMMAERLVRDAEIAEAGKADHYASAIKLQLDAVDNGILGVSDPRVSGELGRI